MTHLIEKQIIELRLTSTKNAFELQQKVSTFCSAQLMPALDDLFSRLAPMHTHIRIDELVIDLGTISEKDMLSNVFLQEILARIERTIQAQIRDNPERTVRTDKETDVFLKWLYFLENGRLPWFSRGTPPSFEADVPKVLAQSEAAIVQLRSLLMQQPTALQRLIQQHPPTFLALIAGLYTGRIQTDLVQVAAALEHFVNRESAQFFWNKVFKRVIFIREKWTVRDVIVHTLGDLLNTLVRQGFIEGNSLKEILPPNKRTTQ